MPITIRDNGKDKEFEESIKRAEKKAKGSAPKNGAVKSAARENRGEPHGKT
jgi:hypothetical protein